jgi:hypothetical protein
VAWRWLLTPDGLLLTWRRQLAGRGLLLTWHRLLAGRGLLLTWHRLLAPTGLLLTARRLARRPPVAVGRLLPGRHRLPNGRLRLRPASLRSRLKRNPLLQRLQLALHLAEPGSQLGEFSEAQSRAGSQEETEQLVGTAGQNQSNDRANDREHDLHQWRSVRIARDPLSGSSFSVAPFLNEEYHAWPQGPERAM